MGWIKRAWRGEERLWIVFWLHGVLLGLILSMVCMDFIPNAFGAVAAIVSGSFYLVYYIWNTVSQWRCAFNTNWHFWGYVVRVMIVLTFIFLSIGLLVGGGLVGRDLLTAAECRKELKEYQLKGGKPDAERFKKDCIERKIAERKYFKSDSSPAAPSPAVLMPNLDKVPESEREYHRMCHESMAQFAKDRAVDPQSYIAQNQAYLKECVQHYKNNAARSNP